MRIFSALAWLFLGCAAHAAYAADAVPATVYFPVLPYEAASDALPQFVPVASNHPLDGAHPGMTRAIIVIPDETRDANASLATMAALAGTANTATMIVAPQFLLPSDLARFASHLPNKGEDFIAWTMTGWQQGDDSVPVQARKPISSFTVTDLLLVYLSDRSLFPDLRDIALAGFGAGGNFVQRYAALGTAPDIVAKQDIALHYVVASATSFLYLTASRPLGGRKGYGVPDTKICPDYNAYPYGLDRLNNYAHLIGANAAKINFATRDITYVVTPAADPVPDTNCAALVQGADGAARAANFDAYLVSLYGDLAARLQNLAVVKDAKNDAVTLFGSSCGMMALFGGGSCPHIIGADQ